jgi:hypothetical protein
MPIPRSKSAAEYRKRAQRLRLAAETALVTEMRQQLLTTAEDYEELADSTASIDRRRMDD